MNIRQSIINPSGAQTVQPSGARFAGGSNHHTDGPNGDSFEKSTAGQPSSELSRLLSGQNLDSVLRLARFYSASSVLSEEEQARQLTSTLWPQVEPYVTDARLLELARKDILTKEAPGPIREMKLTVVGYLEKNREQPEKVRTLLSRLVLLSIHDDHKKLERISRLVQSPEFNRASQREQSTLLFESLGPVLIKALQTVSTQQGFFPPQTQDAMKALYEDVRPVPFSQLKEILEKDLRAPILAVFSEFDRQPVKAGSIAQVHQAHRRRGDKVAVKIVRPEVSQAVQEDIQLVAPLKAILKEARPDLDAEAILDEFARNIGKETSMLEEADNLRRLAERMDERDNVTVPGVHQDISGDNVLVMDWAEGTGLHHAEREQLADEFLRIILRQVFKRGAFQADPHPGNILFDKETDSFTIIDGGMTVFVDKDERELFAKVLLSMFSRRYTTLARLMVPEADEETARQIGRQLKRSYPDGVTTRNAPRVIVDLKENVERRGYEVKEFNPLLWKAMFTALNVSNGLDTDYRASARTARILALYVAKTDPKFLAQTAGRGARSGGRKAKDLAGRGLARGVSRIRDLKSR